MEKTRILVWDLPVRVFHWLLRRLFAGAFLTAESERVRDLHVALGYTFAGLLAFRMAGGVVGSRYARFRSFAFGPQGGDRLPPVAVDATIPFTTSATIRPGSWAIYAILILGLVIGGERLCGLRRRRRTLDRIAPRGGGQRAARAGDRSRRRRDGRQPRASRESGRRDGDRVQVRAAVRGHPRNALGHGGGADCRRRRLVDRDCRDRGWTRAGGEGDGGRRPWLIPSFAPWHGRR